MDHEHIKQQIIENAWGGFNMDYGLLHAQLATPVVTAIILIIVMIALNKLLFQPVLKTLDERTEIVKNNQNITKAAKEEVQRLKQEYQAKQESVRKQISSILHKNKEEAEGRKDELLLEAKKTAETELELERKKLAGEKESIKTELESQKNDIAVFAVKKLIS